MTSRSAIHQRHRTIMRKTKVVATIGPACDDPQTIADMIRAGMNVARVNMSHGTHAEHARRIGMVRAAAVELDANVAVLLDTKGIEIRTGRLRQTPVELVKGATVVLRRDAAPGDATSVHVNYLELARDVAPGHRVLIDDGLLELQVERVDPGAGQVHARVVVGGPLKERKGVNLPDSSLHRDLLDEENRVDLAFAAAQGVEYVAASFMRSAEDVRAIREELQRHGVRIPIIAKIENRSGVENLDAIVAEADGTMVARGDLGVQCPLEEVPLIQKQIIRTTVTAGKPVVTATQMLDSMERNPRPTRAEVTDVANAIFDGTSAVMLSGETAAGQYPVAAVRTMSRIALEAEQALADYGYLQKLPHQSLNQVTEAVSQAAVTMASRLNAAAIVALTESGFTARNISKYRPAAAILALSPDPLVVRRFALNWGITAVRWHKQELGNDDAAIFHALEWAKVRGYVRAGDLTVVTTGVARQAGSTNMIRVVAVPGEA